MLLILSSCHQRADESLSQEEQVLKHLGTTQQTVRGHTFGPKKGVYIMWIVMQQVYSL